MYPAGTIKAIIGGTLPSGEEFAWGFQMENGVGTTQLVLDELAGSVSAAVANNLLTPTVKGYYNVNVVFTTVTLYLYAGGTDAQLISTTGIPDGAGTNANAPVPNQCAIVVTLNTGVPGRSNRGRSYLPCVAANQVGADTQLSQTVCTTLAQAYASMLEAIATGSPADAVPAVASATKGASRPIVSVTVDSKIDTQRRRARNEQALRRATAALS